jgi:hypothetical protein
LTDKKEGQMKNTTKWSTLYNFIWGYYRSWLYRTCNWIYNYLCNQCILPLTLWVWNVSFGRPHHKYWFCYPHVGTNLVFDMAERANDVIILVELQSSILMSSLPKFYGRHHQVHFQFYQFLSSFWEKAIINFPSTPAKEIHTL